MINVCMQIHWWTYQMNKYFLKVSDKDTLGCYFLHSVVVLQMYEKYSLVLTQRLNGNWVQREGFDKSNS